MFVVYVVKGLFWLFEKVRMRMPFDEFDKFVDQKLADSKVFAD